MPVSEIAKARNCGILRFHSILQYPENLNETLERCALKPDAENLIEVDSKDAVATLAHWLAKDAAYGIALMSTAKAQDLALRFVSEFSDPKSRYFTNGHWFVSEKPNAWHSFTDSIFDGGLLISSGEGNDTRLVCIWFEDED